MGQQEEDFQSLSFLLKASSKKLVLELCRDVHKHGCLQAPCNPPLNKKISTTLSITEPEASQLSGALERLIHRLLFESLSSAEEIGSLFPESFHNNLKDLLVRIFQECSTEWRTDCIQSTVSLPRLVDFNYRVDFKMVAENSELSIPACVLDLQIMHPSCETSEMVSVELSREKLDTMLHGLARIRDQLSSVANK